MDEITLDKYRRAGIIAAKAREYGVNLIKSGASLLDVANSVESKIIENGCGLAFPVNISLNEIAAHFSPKHNDTLVFKKGDIVKLDIGTHIDGFIADTAITVEVETNDHSEMIKASSDALDAAIETIKPGIDFSKVGKSIEDSIKAYGFKSVNNLTGHSLEKFSLHSGTSVPNVADMFCKNKPKVDDVFAIEPFATNGAGHVISGPGSNIFLCQESIRTKLVRDNKSKMIFNKLKAKFNTLPFAQRWVEDIFSNSDVVLRKLAFHGLLKHYPQLIEAKKGIVTQKEHTVIITEDGCEVTT
jgi:methionyl aminopeptidase